MNQGCVLSPTISNVVVEYIIMEAQISAEKSSDEDVNQRGRSNAGNDGKW